MSTGAKRVEKRLNEKQKAILDFIEEKAVPIHLHRIEEEFNFTSSSNALNTLMTLADRRLINYNFDFNFAERK